MKVILTHMTDNPVAAIEEAACNCYNSTPTNGKIMKACYSSGHHSVLEFANFTFHIEGVSRALLAQLTRHRHAGYAVRSQRYCAENEFEYVVPPTIKPNSEIGERYHKLMREIADWYSEAQDYGIPNEDARYALPNACHTSLEFTCNGRELIHIMNERLCTRAQWEIRQLCLLMKTEVEKACPQFAEYLVPKCEKHGKDKAFCTEHASCGRHPTLKSLLVDKNN